MPRGRSGSSVRAIPKAPPERLSLWFSSHDVLITGWHLDHLRQLLRSGRSYTVTATDPRYLNLKPKECFVAEVIVLNAGTNPAY